MFAFLARNQETRWVRAKIGGGQICVAPQSKPLPSSVGFQTRVLVTHAVQYLPYVDQIIVLQDGVISEVCTLFDFLFLPQTSSSGNGSEYEYSKIPVLRLYLYNFSRKHFLLDEQEILRANGHLPQTDTQP